MPDLVEPSDLERVLHGTVSVGSGKEPILVGDPSRAWIVLSGSVELFLVRVRDGQLAGARHHAATVTANQAFFGVDHSTFTDLWALIACPGQSTRLLEISRNEASLPGTADHIPLPLRLLVEQWIATLSASAAEGVEPKVFTAVEAGTELVVDTEASPVVAAENVVWIRHLTGAGAFLGRETLPAVEGDVAFPLCRPAWIAEQAGNRLIVLPTADVLQSADDWRMLDFFHAVVVSALIMNVLADEERDVARLHAKISADQARLDTSFLELARPLRRGRNNDTVAPDASGVPLLAALQSVGSAAGITFRPHPDLIRHMPMKDPVAAIARFSGVRFRRVALGQYWWKSEGSPLLGFREADKRPLALLPEGGRYTVSDPVEGSERRRVTPEIASTLEPFAYTFYRPFPREAISALQLVLFGVRGSWRDVFLILLMGLLGGLLGMATPILTGTIFDTIIPGAQRGRLLEMAVFLASASLSGVFFQMTRGFAVLRLEGKVEASVQAAVWDRLLSLPVPFFRQYSAGDLAMRSLAINTMRQMLSGSAMSAVLSGVFSVFSLVLLFYYSWRLALIGCGLTLIVILATGLASYLQLRQQRELMKIGGKLAGLVLQLIVGIAKFRVSATENRAFAAWAALFGRQKTLAMKNRSINNWMAVFNSVFPLVSLLVIFFAMAYFMSQPGSSPLTTGQFMAFNSAYGQFSGSLLQLSQVFVTLIGIGPLYKRAKPVLDTLPEVDPAQTHPGDLTGAIELSHLSFRYKEDGPVVLNDVSFSIKAGEFVAVVGPSGSGKSTLFRMLLGFETPESGALYFDGQDLARLDIQSVRQQMGVVLQNATLFSGDIYSNIVCASPYTIDEAWEAATLVGLEPDLRQMPMGMHTIVGDGGAGLSGGQRQRLMMARAVVGKPRILLFDEATSALDNQTQAIVSRSLENLKATRIVIAHRLSTIINADKIVVIQDGSIVQTGTYGELVEQPGLFAELAKRQLV